MELLAEEEWREHWMAGAAKQMRNPSPEAIRRVTQGRAPEEGDPNFALLGGVKAPAPEVKRRGGWGGTPAPPRKPEKEKVVEEEDEGQVQPTSSTLHHTPYTLHSAPYTLHSAPYTLHPTPCILHLTPYTLHRTCWRGGARRG